jgi:hypothetical protein
VGGRAVTSSWITPWQQRIRHYAELSGIGLRPRHPVVERRSHDGVTLRLDSPCSVDERPAFDGTMARVRSDVERFQESGGGEVVAISLNAYLDRIAASPAARLHVMAWWTISGNGDPDQISAAEFLSSCSYGGGAWDWHDWVADPWACGTWVALPSDALAVWSPEGRLAFASSDYAPQSPGWFEAAILAGEDAAHALLKRGNRSVDATTFVLC